MGREEVIKKFKENDFYKDIEYLNNYDDIFDSAIIENNGWFIYGCCKPKREPYLLTYIFDGNINNEIIKNDFLKLNIKKKNVSPSRKRSREYGEEDIEYAQKLIKLFNVDRADNYQTWLEVGWALF